PEASRRTSPSYRLSRSVVAMEAVASAVGSSEVGSWMMPMMAFGLVEAAAAVVGFAAAAATVAVGAAVGAAGALVGAVVGLAGAGAVVGATVGGMPVVGG